MSRGIINSWIQQAVWDLQAEEDARMFEVLDDVAKSFEWEIERNIKRLLNNPERYTEKDIKNYMYKIVKDGNKIEILRHVLTKIWPEQLITLNNYLLLK